MHRISRTHIKNFRSCSNLEVTLADFTPIVGYNNCGKSNFLLALKWGISPWTLQEDDFFDIGSPVVIELQIQGVSTDILEAVKEKHRKRIAPFCVDKALSLRRLQPRPGGSKNAITLEILSPDGEWKKNPAGIDAAIKVLYPEPIEVKAMDDAAEDVGKSKTTTTIGKLIAEVVKPIEEQQSEALHLALEGIRAKLDAEGDDRPQELVHLDEGTNLNLKDLFPSITVKMHVPMPELKDLFKGGTLIVFEEGDEQGRTIESMGNGAQRSIQMALVRYLADIKKGDASGSCRTLLLVDEPELYLHPHGIEQVRAALKSLSEVGYQVVFATHSPLMISPRDAKNTLIFQKNCDDGTKIRPRIVDAANEILSDSPSQTEIIFELSNLSQILFSDCVLLAEGKTESRIIPELFEAHFDTTLGTCRIGLVSPQGAGGLIACKKIIEFMGITAKCVVDLDFAFRTAIQDELYSADDPDLQLAREICASNAGKIGFKIGDDGFPIKSGSRKAAEAFEELANVAEFSSVVDSLHKRLSDNGIWLWKRGAIEAHLGIDEKKISQHHALVTSVRDHGISGSVADPDGVIDFLNWVAHE